MVWMKLAEKLFKGVKAVCNVKNGMAILTNTATIIRQRRTFSLIKRVLITKRKLYHAEIIRAKKVKRMVLREW